MDATQLLKKIEKKLPTNTSPNEIAKAFAISYLAVNGVSMGNSKELMDNLASVDSTVVSIIKKSVDEAKYKLSLHSLVEFFELLIPDTTKKENGIVYTPSEVKDFIIEKCINKYEEIVNVCDPSCGCGSFLISVAEYLHTRFGVSYTEILSKHIFGVDIDEQAIERAKVLLYLLLHINGECTDINLNLICGDMLNLTTFDKMRELAPTGFDCVVGNPPYVRNRNIIEPTKSQMNNWECASNGNVDLYMPFYEVGLKLLSSNGVLGYISPNTFLQAVNGRSLRNFFATQSARLEITDFRDSQVFKNVTSYTCVVIAEKNSDGVINYSRIKENETLGEQQYTSYEINDFEKNKPWRLCDSENDSIIAKLEKTGISLGHWKIRNGLATLKNELFFFVPEREDNAYYYRIYNDIEYAIEKSICINMVKPNVVKSEKELKENREKAIFPYTKVNDIFSIIEESIMMDKYPCAYKFLKDYKDLLMQRDKGKGKYPAWYAYGRTQGMNNFGKKLLIPYISGTPAAVLSLDEDLLFYCGYALLCDDVDTLKVLKVFLESDAFWYYICHTSKPYSKGFMALAKNYIVKFAIPELSKSEIKMLLSETNSKKRNELIWKMYDIEPNQISA